MCETCFRGALSEEVRILRQGCGKFRKTSNGTVPYRSAASPGGPGPAWASPAPLSRPVFALRMDSGAPGRWASGPGEPGAPRAECPAAQPPPGMCPQYRHGPPGPDILAHSFMNFLSSWACQAVVTLAFHVTVDPSAPGPGPPAGWALSPPSPQALPSTSTPVQLSSTRAWKRPCPLSPPPPDFSAPSQASGVASWEVVAWRTALTLAHTQASRGDLWVDRLGVRGSTRWRQTPMV